MAKRSRAINDQQKNARRETILEAALDLFRQSSFEEVNIADVARKAGIAKGTVYLYFKSKEEMFLELQKRAYAEWFRAMERELAKGRPSIPKVVGLFTETLAERPDFLRLMAILHTILEQNIPPETALEFKQSLHDGALRIGELLEENLEFLKSGEGSTLLVRTQALVIGLHHLANPSQIVEEVLEREEMNIFKVDFSKALGETLSILLIGLKSLPR